jgi:ribosome-associated toxin RatA of RatAB toxin-antitoxin module
MNQLQRSLQLNAGFSGISGVLLIVLHNSIANVFEVSGSYIFWLIGAGLLLFSALILYEIKRKNTAGVLFIAFQDLLWVLGSLVLLIFQPFDISKTGNGMIAGVALVVFLICINQLAALAQTDDDPKKGVKQLRFIREVNASKQKVWKAVSDVGNYHNVAPNIDDVQIISGEGKGMVRSCSHKKDSWTETCTMWEEEKQYSFLVNTDAPDYPYPFKYLKGNWKIIETDKSSTKIEMIFNFEYRRKYQLWILHPLLKIRFSKIAEELLDNWQKEVESN